MLSWHIVMYLGVPVVYMNWCYLGILWCILECQLYMWTELCILGVTTVFLNRVMYVGVILGMLEPFLYITRWFEFIPRYGISFGLWQVFVYKGSLVLYGRR